MHHNQMLSTLRRSIRVITNISVMSWLPGKGEVFSFAPRKIDGTRPLVCVTSVTKSGKILFGACISRPVNGLLTYKPLVDLHRPVEEILNGRNSVLAGVCFEHLKRLSWWASQQVRYVEPVPAPVWPNLLVPKVFDGESFTSVADLQPEQAAAEINGEMCYEDFRPILNAGYFNPAKLLARPENPATDVCSRNKVLAGNLMSVIEQTADAEGLLKKLVSDMREAIPLGYRYTENELLKALENPKAPLPNKDWVSFVEGRPDEVVAAMRRLLKPAIGRACEDADLLAAAYEPRGPLTVAFRSELQVCKSEDLARLPAFYAGSILPVERTPAPTANIEDDMTPVVSSVPVQEGVTTE